MDTSISSAGKYVFQRNFSVLEAALGVDYVLFHPSTGDYCHINEVGNRIWNILAAPKNLDDLVDTLTGTYAIDREPCKADTVPFLNTLEQGSFISVVKSS